MKTVFADSVFYIGMLNRKDQHQPACSRFSLDFNGRYLTTTAVLTEVGNHLAASAGRTWFPRLVARLQSDPNTRIVGETSGLWSAALHLYGSRPDKEWSLTDCLSFVVMEEEGITDAVTTDHHFQQAGFNVLLKL